MEALPSPLLCTYSVDIPRPPPLCPFGPSFQSRLGTLSLGSRMLPLKSFQRGLRNRLDIKVISAFQNQIVFWPCNYCTSIHQLQTPYIFGIPIQPRTVKTPSTLRVTRVFASGPQATATAGTAVLMTSDHDFVDLVYCEIVRPRGPEAARYCPV